jgi:hypothetical protein
MPFPLVLRERAGVRGNAASPPRRAERGSAVLVVLVLIAVMVIVSMSNVDTLGALKKEIQLIERQQQKGHEQSPAH